MSLRTAASCWRARLKHCVSIPTYASSTSDSAAITRGATATSSSTVAADAGMADDAALELAEVGLSFGGLQVLQGVSLNTHSGELLCLIGPNGAGKTSVLNCICGIYRPTAGRITFAGHDLTTQPPHRIARLGLGRTFQHGELVLNLSVVENLLIARHARIGTRLLAEALYTRSVRDEEAIHRRAVEEVLDFTELGKHRHDHVGSLPFGLQKIVGFARALAMEPRLLLLDEPSA